MSSRRMGPLWLRFLSSGDLFDTTRCTSNTITEIMSTLGVDATHTLLFRECADVLGDSGEYVAACHLNLLTRKMTHQGQPLSATRHGMKRANQGVLVSASFERTVDTFVEAAVHAKVDQCNGVTECIVMNRLPRMGTGYVGMIEEAKKEEATQSTTAQPAAAAPKFIGRRRGASTQFLFQSGILEDARSRSSEWSSCGNSKDLYTSTGTCVRDVGCRRFWRRR